MEELTFVLLSLIVLSGGLVFLNFLLKKNEIQEFIKKDCNYRGFTAKDGSFVSLSPFHPNNICYIRAGLAWIGIIFYYFGFQYVGIEFYLTSVYLDAVDGMVARACKLVTEKGEKIDPLYDKATYLPPIIFLFSDLTIVYFFLFFETIGQFVVRKILDYQKRSGAANNFGKIKALFAFSIFPYMFVVQNCEYIPDISQQLMIICTFLSLCSAVFKLIPNKFYADILSILNLLCGVAGIVFISNGKFVSAALFVLLGQVFDVFDGRAAVKHGGTKAGPWLDDIADLASFGFCPAFMIWEIGDNVWLKIIAIIFLFSIIFRLVRFVTIDKERKDYRDYIFFGLPSPAGAAVVMGTCLISKALIIIGVVTILTSLLSIGSYKFIHLGRGIAKQLPRPAMIIGSAALLILLAYLRRIDSQLGIGYFFVFGALSYIVLSEVYRKRLSI